MKYIPIIIVIIVILLFFSCKNKVSKTLDDMNPEVLKKEIINTGSIASFKLLSMYYDDKKMDEDFLDISILMYEKYNYTNALSNIYYAYIYKYNPNIPFYNGDKEQLFKNVPKKEQEIALKYLEIGVEKGDYACIESLSDYYLSIGKIDKSKELLKLQEDLVENHKKKVNDSLSKIQDIKK
jgi:hypothetical protein